MSPSKTNASASESSRPRKASTQKQRPGKATKLRKIPKPLYGVPVCHYGAKFEDFINGDATIRVQPPVVSESVAPLHVTTQDTLYLASCFPPANFVHSQIPVSERCLDDAARVNPGAEPFYMPIPFPYGLDNDSQSANNILSTTNSPCQSYGRYANNDQSCDFLPSSSTGMEYCDERYQQWLESLDPNTYSIIPHSILSNHDASTTFHGNSYNDIMLYAEIAGTALGSDGTTSHFPNYDANNPHSYYM